MKVKKVLSLVLAVVMIFTMIPAQLILSGANKAGYPTPVIGDAVKYNTDVTLEKDGDYAGLVKVAFQASVKYPESLTTNQQKSIVTLEEIVDIDTTILEPVNYDGTESILSTVKTNAGSAPAYAWVVDPDIEDVALFSEQISALVRNKPTNVSYSLALTALSYNNDTMYIHFVAQQSPSGYVWANEDQFCTVGYMYFKLAEGKELTDVKSAIKNASESDLQSDTGCRAATFNCESVVSTQPEPNRFVSDVNLAFSSDFDPVVPTTYDITFTWKNGAETTGAVEYQENAPVTAPAGSTADYSDDDYDYTFTGWKNTAGTEYAKGTALPNATETTTYTAQYTKSVDTTALETEYNKDKGLVESDYTEETWGPFAEALAAAKAILDGTTPTQPTKQDVATALNNLTATAAALKEKPQAEPHSITFSWQNGTKTETVDTQDGQKPQLPQGSDAESDYTSADGKTKYTFKGWKDATGTTYDDATALPAATQDATYTAVYDESDVTVKITFDVNGTKTVKDIPYGEMVTVQDAPVVEDYDSPDGDTHYTFKEWSPAFVEATEPATYTAQFDSKQNDAIYDDVTAALVAAQEIIDAAGDEYADMYTEASRTALNTAMNAVQWEPKLPQSQQQTVNDWAQEIERATEGLTLTPVTLTFYSHEKPEGEGQDYLYGDPVNAPEIEESYVDDQGFKWTLTGWDKDVPATAKVSDQFTAQYQREDVAITADLQTAVDNAVAKRDNGTQWTDESLAALNAKLEEAAPYLEQGAQFPASKQGEIDDLTREINAAAQALTPKDADKFDVTFNWKIDNGADKSDTTQWANGQTPTAPQGAENGYETQDYTFTFMRWEPSIVAVDGANQSYTAIYNDPQPKSADTSALEQAIANAQAKMAETDYQAKYTEGTRTALEGALATGQQVLDSSPLPSQQGTVEQATQAINDALSGMLRNEIRITFYTHENPNGIPQDYLYGDPIENIPVLTAYSEGDYDYTPKTGDAAWSPAVPETAIANGEYEAQYDKTGPIPAQYDENETAVAAARAVLDTPNADKIYTEDYLQGIQDALDNNVQPGLTRSHQGEVSQATANINEAVANPQYNYYTIRFINEGEVVSTDSTYKYGDVVNTPANPTKDPTVDKVFTFKSWDPAVTNVTKDQDYTATYNEGPRPYTVTYLYHNGEATEAVNYGATPQNPPTVPTYIEGGIKYTFKNWDKEFAPVTGPEGNTYTAVYEQEQMPDVTITFRYAVSLEDVKDGKLTDVTQDVTYGEMPVEPTVESFVDGDTTYRFDGWDKTVVAATEEATYTAIYTPVTEFTPDMTEINQLIARYNQMVKSGKYNKDDLKAIKAYIDEIHDTTFTSQDEVNEMAKNLKALEDSCRKIDVQKKKEETKKRSYKRRYSRTSRTGDNATLVVMSVILVSSIGIAVVSLKKRRENI